MVPLILSLLAPGSHVDGKIENGTSQSDRAGDPKRRTCATVELADSDGLALFATISVLISLPLTLRLLVRSDLTRLMETEQGS
jgi:hypothetical protein